MMRSSVRAERCLSRCYVCVLSRTACYARWVPRGKELAPRDWRRGRRSVVFIRSKSPTGSHRWRR
eukprot:1378965-Prymnesium_polylepis.1